MGACSSKADNPKKKSYLIQVLDDHEAGINCAAISEDGSVLATGSEDRTARLWSTKTERCECIGILKGHDDYINCILMEENYVLTGSADKTIRKWDVGSCDCVQVFRGHNSLLNRIICTGDFIFSSSYDRTARCWDFDTGECIRVFSGHKRGVYPLIFIPGDDEEDGDDEADWDGNKDILISGSADFTAKSWSFETGKCLNTFSEHTGAITCMTTDPAGKTLFTGSTDHLILSWDILKGERLKSFEGHQSSVICMVVSNKILYSGSSDMSGRAWVTEFGDCTRTFKGHRHTVSCIVYHEGLVFTGCGDGVARCFDAKSAALKRSFTGHTFAINNMQISDGKLFTVSHDGTLRVWDASGITEDTAFGRSDDGEGSTEKACEKGKEYDSNQNPTPNGNGKIMIDDEMNGGKAKGYPDDYQNEADGRNDGKILID